MATPWWRWARRCPASITSLLVSLRSLLRVQHCLLLGVVVAATASWWCSFELRFDLNVPHQYAVQRLFLLPYVVLFKLGLFYLLGGYYANWRYFGLRDVPRLILHSAVSSGIIFLLATSIERLRIPRGVILIDFFMGVVLIGGVHVSMRLLVERLLVLFRRDQRTVTKQVVVIGAGDAGEMLVRDILRTPSYGFQIRALFDDDPRKQGLNIHGIPVVGGVEDVPLFVSVNRMDLVIIAIPSATRTQMRRIHGILKNLAIPVKTLPAVTELMEDFSTVPQLREINVTDLLGREEILINTTQVRDLICGKVVVVTGAGGSIGSELCRQILKRTPKQVVLIERAENSLFHIHRQLVQLWGEDVVVPVLCDVTDAARIYAEFKKFQPDIVFHAAAHKHVFLQELNAVECFRNNVGGIQVLARAADQFSVQTFLLISTDKAVNPTSVMGATKRVCELYGQGMASKSSTTFLSVRFGNVLASEGSVVPIFLEQIKKGGPVTVTHPEMRRYFMTIPEAVTLVLQAAAIGKSGQILILDMGEPVRILDLVQNLVHLAGKEPAEIPIEFVGPRPGEKLFEELRFDAEAYASTVHPKIAVLTQQNTHDPHITETIDAAMDRIREGVSDAEVRLILKSLVPEYTPDQWYERSQLGTTFKEYPESPLSHRPMSSKFDLTTLNVQVSSNKTSNKVPYSGPR